MNKYQKSPSELSATTACTLVFTTTLIAVQVGNAAQAWLLHVQEEEQVQVQEDVQVQVLCRWSSGASAGAGAAQALLLQLGLSLGALKK